MVYKGISDLVDASIHKQHQTERSRTNQNETYACMAKCMWLCLQGYICRDLYVDTEIQPKKSRIEQNGTKQIKSEPKKWNQTNTRLSQARSNCFHVYQKPDKASRKLVFSVASMEVDLCEVPLSSSAMTFFFRAIQVSLRGPVPLSSHTLYRLRYGMIERISFDRIHYKAQLHSMLLNAYLHQSNHYNEAVTNRLELFPFAIIG